MGKQFVMKFAREFLLKFNEPMNEFQIHLRVVLRCKKRINCTKHHWNFTNQNLLCWMRKFQFYVNYQSRSTTQPWTTFHRESPTAVFERWFITKIFSTFLFSYESAKLKQSVPIESVPESDRKNVIETDRHIHRHVWNLFRLTSREPKLWCSKIFEYEINTLLNCCGLWIQLALAYVGWWRRSA